MFSFRRKKSNNRKPIPQSVASLSLEPCPWLERKEDKKKLECTLEEMNFIQKEELFWSDWHNLDWKEQRRLAQELFSDNWIRLILTYHSLSEVKQVQVIEALGYIPDRAVVDFLLEEMKKDKENIRIAASSALRSQDPHLTLEPMLKALTQPEVWMPSRVYEVLKSIGPKLVQIILEKIMDVDLSAQKVMVQLLGELGDDSVLPTLSVLAQNPDYHLRKVIVEALTRLKNISCWPILEIFVNDNNWQIRMMAVELVGELRIRESRWVLQKRLFMEEDPLVREMVLEVINTLDEIEMPITAPWVRDRKVRCS